MYIFVIFMSLLLLLEIFEWSNLLEYIWKFRQNKCEVKSVINPCALEAVFSQNIYYFQKFYCFKCYILFQILFWLIVIFHRFFVAIVTITISLASIRSLKFWLKSLLLYHFLFLNYKRNIKRSSHFPRKWLYHSP